MSESSLPDEDHVARYCKPSAVGTDGLPKVAAFELREQEASLSVNWLEYFGPDRDVSIAEVRQVIRITLRPNGRFAVLNVAAAREAVVAGGGSSPKVTSDPVSGDPSHASISGYTIDDFLVAVELKALVRSSGRLYGAHVRQSIELSVGHRASAETGTNTSRCRVKRDRRSGIENDPNRADDPQYIVRLIGKVISVNLETVAIVKGLQELGVGQD